MVEFANLHIQEEKKRFDEQKRAGPDEHWAGQKVDLPNVDRARSEGCEAQTSKAYKKEVAQDVGRIDSVIGFGAVFWRHRRIRSSLCSSNICLAEIVPLKKEGLPGHLRKRIRKAIAEVQLCRVASLAEI